VSKSILPPLALGLFLAAPAVAAPSVEAAFGNTIVSTYPDGRTAKLWLHRGGAYDGRGRRGKPSSGQWTIKGDKICLRQKKPTPAPFAYCTPLSAGGVGAAWSARAVTGEPIRVSVVKGR
jgi:hypothetical protein